MMRGSGDIPAVKSLCRQAYWSQAQITTHQPHEGTMRKHFFVEYYHAGAAFPHSGHHEMILTAKNEEEARKPFVKVEDMDYKENEVHRLGKDLIVITHFEEVIISDTNMTSADGSNYEDYDIQSVRKFNLDNVEWQ